MSDPTLAIRSFSSPTTKDERCCIRMETAGGRPAAWPIVFPTLWDAHRHLRDVMIHQSQKDRWLAPGEPNWWQRSGVKPYSLGIWHIGDPQFSETTHA